MAQVTFDIPNAAVADFAAALGVPADATAQEKAQACKANIADYVRNVVSSYRRSLRSAPQPTDDVTIT